MSLSRKEQIIEVVINKLKENSLTDISLASIAKEVNIGKSTLPDPILALTGDHARSADVLLAPSLRAGSNRLRMVCCRAKPVGLWVHSGTAFAWVARKDFLG